MWNDVVSERGVSLFVRAVVLRRDASYHIPEVRGVRLCRRRQVLHTRDDKWKRKIITY